MYLFLCFLYVLKNVSFYWFFSHLLMVWGCACHLEYTSFPLRVKGCNYLDVTYCWSHSFSPPSQSLKHNPNGRFVVVCGDGEYIIYTALAWRNRSFGSALEFVWSSDGEYAIRESTSRIKIFSKNFQVSWMSSQLTPSQIWITFVLCFRLCVI